MVIFSLFSMLSVTYCRVFLCNILTKILHIISELDVLFWQRCIAVCNRQKHSYYCTIARDDPTEDYHGDEPHPIAIPYSNLLSPFPLASSFPHTIHICVTHVLVLFMLWVKTRNIQCITDKLLSICVLKLLVINYYSKKFLWSFFCCLLSCPHCCMDTANFNLIPAVLPWHLMIITIIKSFQPRFIWSYKPALLAHFSSPKHLGFRY